MWAHLGGPCFVGVGARHLGESRRRSVPGSVGFAFGDQAFTMSILVAHSPAKALSRVVLGLSDAVDDGSPPRGGGSTHGEFVGASPVPPVAVSAAPQQRRGRRARTPGQRRIGGRPFLVALSVTPERLVVCPWIGFVAGFAYNILVTHVLF